MRSSLATCLTIVALQGCGGVDDDRPATLDYIAPVILAPRCATSSCHSAGAAVAGLDLSTAANAWQSLRDLSLPAASPRLLVVPFNPVQSRLVRLLRADETGRMPPGRPLAEADIALIERWILEGAGRD